MKKITNKEDYFISLFSQSKHIGDDGAVIGKWVYSMDAFFENIHFKREWMSLEQIATKSMLVNISDAIAMNAKPKFALISICLPKEFEKKELKALAKGFNKTAKKFGLQIIGGDTIAGNSLDISITIISKTKKPLLRSGAKVGDLVCHTGKLGSVKKDLEKLLNNQLICCDSKFVTPKLHPKFLYKAASYINCALDISDGLFFELERISKASRVGFELDETITSEIGCSGEEYEILFTCDPTKFELINTLALKYYTPISVIGKVTRGSFTPPCKPHHF
ncbi:MAG: thiamine-phosphate kinase [Campylobacterales bacterium]|nr:thiamine-phosphate kinase [Campylobacterales bacterium]